MAWQKHKRIANARTRDTGRDLSPKTETLNPRRRIANTSRDAGRQRHIKYAETHQVETRGATSRKRGGGVLGGKADKEGVCAAHRPQRDPSVRVTRDARDSATQRADTGQWHKRSGRQRSGRERVPQAQRDPKVRERIA